MGNSTSTVVTTAKKHSGFGIHEALIEKATAAMCSKFAIGSYFGFEETIDAEALKVIEWSIASEYFNGYATFGNVSGSPLEMGWSSCWHLYRWSL